MGDAPAGTTAKDKAGQLLGNLLFDLIIGGSLLAGIGSLYYGIRLTMDLSALQPRGVVFRTRMTTGIGSMAILAAFWPCWSSPR